LLIGNLRLQRDLQNAHGTVDASREGLRGGFSDKRRRGYSLLFVLCCVRKLLQTMG
jgi:hypothetical protein